MERSRKRQYSRDSFTHWAHDAVLIGRMAERGHEIVAMDGGLVMGKICYMFEEWRWR